MKPEDVRLASTEVQHWEALEQRVANSATATTIEDEAQHVWERLTKKNATGNLLLSDSLSHTIDTMRTARVLGQILEHGGLTQNAQNTLLLADTQLYDRIVAEQKARLAREGIQGGWAAFSRLAAESGGYWDLIVGDSTSAIMPSHFSPYKALLAHRVNQEIERRFHRNTLADLDPEDQALVSAMIEQLAPSASVYSGQQLQAWLSDPAQATIRDNLVGLVGADNLDSQGMIPLLAYLRGTPLAITELMAINGEVLGGGRLRTEFERLDGLYQPRNTARQTRDREHDAQTARLKRLEEAQTAVQSLVTGLNACHSSPDYIQLLESTNQVTELRERFVTRFPATDGFPAISSNVLDLSNAANFQSEIRALKTAQGNIRPGEPLEAAEVKKRNDALALLQQIIEAEHQRETLQLSIVELTQSLNSEKTPKKRREIENNIRTAVRDLGSHTSTSNRLRRRANAQYATELGQPLTALTPSLPGVIEVHPTDQQIDERAEEVKQRRIAGWHEFPNSRVDQLLQTRGISPMTPEAEAFMDAWDRMVARQELMGQRYNFTADPHTPVAPPVDLNAELEPLRDELANLEVLQAELSGAKDERELGAVRRKQAHDLLGEIITQEEKRFEHRRTIELTLQRLNRQRAQYERDFAAEIADNDAAHPLQDVTAIPAFSDFMEQDALLATITGLDNQVYLMDVAHRGKTIEYDTAKKAWEAEKARPFDDTSDSPTPPQTVGPLRQAGLTTFDALKTARDKAFEAFNADLAARRATDTETPKTLSPHELLRRLFLRDPDIQTTSQSGEDRAFRAMVATVLMADMAQNLTHEGAAVRTAERISRRGFRGMTTRVWEASSRRTFNEFVSDALLTDPRFAKLKNLNLDTTVDTIGRWLGEGNKSVLTLEQLGDLIQQIDLAGRDLLGGGANLAFSEDVRPLLRRLKTVYYTAVARKALTDAPKDANMTQTAFSSLLSARLQTPDPNAALSLETPKVINNRKKLERARESAQIEREQGGEEKTAQTYLARIEKWGPWIATALGVPSKLWKIIDLIRKLRK